MVNIKLYWMLYLSTQKVQQAMDGPVAVEDCQRHPIDELLGSRPSNRSPAT